MADKRDVGQMGKRTEAEKGKHDQRSENSRIHARAKISPLERGIEKKLILPIRKLGGLCLKFETPGYTGVPDRIILLPGGVVRFVELKAPGKKERARQQYVQQVLRMLGFTVYSTVDSMEKIDTIIQDCKEALGHGESV